MEAIALSLLMWIGANSGYPVPDAAALPPIRLLDAEAMTRLYHEQTGGGEGAGAPRIDRRVQGYYSWAEAPHGVIYLVHPEDTPGAEAFADPRDNPLFRERLLHELVHFAQHMSGAYARYHCSAQGEFDAFRLGGIYLRQLEVPDPLPARMAFARRLNFC